MSVTRWGSFLVTVLVLASCGDAPTASSGGQVETASTTSSPPNPVEECSGEPVDLVEGRAPAAAGDDGYDYHQVLKSDLDADGTYEMVHLVASVEKRAPDNYIWEDGHGWHLYVEEPDGHRTYVFSNWIQFGALDVHLISPGESTLAIQHDSANYFGLYCAQYLGPGKVRSTKLADYTPSADHFTWAD